MALTDNLVSYWKLDEASGNALDAHGLNDLTDNNTVGSAAGKINNARSFASASSEYFSHTDNADLSTGDIDFTFTAWVNATTLSGNQRIINKINSAVTVLEYQLFYAGNNDGKLTLEVFNGGGGSVGTAKWGTAPSTSTWYFIVAWHDSVNNQVGISVNNGTPVTASTTGAPADTSASFSIGSLDGLGSTYWDGLIDEVGFWKRVLTSQERTDLYNGGAGLSYDSFAGASGALSGTSAATSGATGTLTGTGALSGTSAATSGATGTVSGTGALSGASAATSDATGALTGATSLSGTAASTSSATATLAGIGTLSGAAEAVSQASGALTNSTTLAGVAASTSAATATLSAVGALIASSQIVSSAIGVLADQTAAPAPGTATLTSSGYTATLTNRGASAALSNLP